ncbi:hypothetical protein EX30DRAFT_342003 [Ascodesmis nigricans]|uniref:Uncharacterized protein n=1 Tax=Ascodesmis nigricans TaxID=341454 RepID=A0A4S2MTW2_9PEZI|nr:hypothetical protein EX30DRAFT_342003 [Ascodesmis nigricans]
MATLMTPPTAPPPPPFWLASTPPESPYLSPRIDEKAIDIPSAAATTFLSPLSVQQPFMFQPILTNHGHDDLEDYDDDLEDYDDDADEANEDIIYTVISHIFDDKAVPDQRQENESSQLEYPTVWGWSWGWGSSCRR